MEKCLSDLPPKTDRGAELVNDRKGYPSCSKILRARGRILSGFA